MLPALNRNVNHKSVVRRGEIPSHRRVSIASEKTKMKNKMWMIAVSASLLGLSMAGMAATQYGGGQSSGQNSRQHRGMQGPNMMRHMHVYASDFNIGYLKHNLMLTDSEVSTIRAADKKCMDDMRAMMRNRGNNMPPPPGDEDGTPPPPGGTDNGNPPPGDMDNGGVQGQPGMADPPMGSQNYRMKMMEQCKQTADASIRSSLTEDQNVMLSKLIGQAEKLQRLGIPAGALGPVDLNGDQIIKLIAISDNSSDMEIQHKDAMMILSADQQDALHKFMQDHRMGRPGMGGPPPGSRMGPPPGAPPPGNLGQTPPSAPPG